MDTSPAPRSAAGTGLAAEDGAARARLTLTVACLGFFLIALDATVVNVSLPSIGREFGSTVAGLQWVADAYTLMFASLLLSSGAMSDRLGASRSYTVGLAAFTVSSVLCGCAPGLGALIGFRAVQGVAAAVMLPSSLALVRQAFPDAAARARAIAAWTAAGGVAVAVGPVAGGTLTALLGWRAIFFLNVPLGALGALGMRRATRSVAHPAPLDMAGQVTATVSLAALTFAVIEGGARGLDPVVVGALVMTALGAAAFPLIESRAAHPMVPLRLFRYPAVSVCAAVGFVLNFTTYGLIFLLSLYLQEIRHEPALTAGLMFLPMTAVIAVVNVLSGRLAARSGPWLPILLGQAILTIALAGLLAGGTTIIAVLLVLLVPVGVGGGMTVPPITTALLNAVDTTSAGLASGLLNASRQVGGALAVALFGALVARPGSFATGMRLSLLIAVAALLVTLVVSAFLLRQPARSR